MSFSNHKNRFLTATESGYVGMIYSRLHNMLSDISRLPHTPKWSEMNAHYSARLKPFRADIPLSESRAICTELETLRNITLEHTRSFYAFRRQRKRNGFRGQSSFDFEQSQQLADRIFETWKRVIPTIRRRLVVTCAIIEHKGEAMAAQRSANMSHPLRWEFPGGKQNGTEPLDQCIRRELMEEFEIKVKIKAGLRSASFAYPDFDILLIPYVCELKSKDIVVKEHKQIGWFTPGSMRNVKWSDADVEVVEIYRDFCAANPER